MKNILIISKYFGPVNGIASIRWTKLVKYLDRMNKYKITVVAWKPGKDALLDGTLKKDISNYSLNVNIIYIDHIYDTFSTKIVKVYHQWLKKGSKIEAHKMLGYVPYKDASIKQKLKLNIKYLRYLNHEKRFVRIAFHRIKPLLKDMDVIVSSYGDFGDLLLALKIKKRHPKIRFIADYRDPVDRYFWPPVLKPFIKKLIKNVALYADKIIGVTEECIDAHKYPEKNVIIPNGYDLEDRNQIPKRISNDGKFHICLTGTVYMERRDHFYVLYEALKKLSQEKKIRLEDIVIDYAGNYSWYVCQQAQKNGMDNLVRDHGYVSRERALIIQNQANLLMVLSCNNEGESGVLTGKFLEYMMMNRKILALISGNKPNSIIKQIISEGNLGFCYEEAAGEKDFIDLCEFLYDSYIQYKENGNVLADMKQEILDHFNYVNIASAMDNVINS